MLFSDIEYVYPSVLFHHFLFFRANFLFVSVAPSNILLFVDFF